MSKRMKVIVSVLVAVVLLTVGGVAAVMAQGEPTPTPEVSAKGRLATGVEPQIKLSKFSGYVGDNMTAGLLARVAENLGVTDEELSNAFSEAWQEMREEAFIRFLDKALENERITEPEYDAIIAWWEDRPDAVDSLFPHAFGTPGLGSRHMWGARINPAILGKHMWGGYRGWCGPKLPKVAD